ncbi:MAG: hypothetical protein JWQ25_2871 [Daejeonella sp.]|nr:hypothetical protein [Daejeonella sp.]
MIITNDQVKELNIYLASILKYQETVDEIADHILSSLEGIQTDISFSSAVTNIINDDFGSAEGLVVMEKQSQNLIAKNLINSLLSHFIAYLKFPKLLHVLALLLIFYYALGTYEITISFLALAFYFLAIIPSVMYLIRYFYSGYYMGSIKKSIKDKTIAGLGARALAIANTLVMYPLMIMGKPQLNAFISSNPILVSVLFVLLSVYVLSFVQLNQTELRKYMVKR